jgi:RNA polymerase sigma factor (sigma-70 family)
MNAIPTLKETDARLLRRVAEGDIAAFDEFYRRHCRNAYGVALGVVVDPKLAEDVVQEAFLNVWRSAARFDGRRASSGTWLHMLVHRRAVDAVRRGERYRAEELGAQSDERLEAALPDPEYSPQAVRAQLAALPTRDRELLVWAHYEGLTQAEIAERADLPLGTVKSRMFQAYR